MSKMGGDTGETHMKEALKGKVWFYSTVNCCEMYVPSG